VTPSVDTLRRGGERLMQEVAREYYLSQSGHKATAELQPIYARHASVLSDDALASVREQFLASQPGSETNRSSRLLLDWQVEGQTSRLLAPLDEREIAWEASAVATLDDGRRIPFQRLAIDIGNSADRSERMRLERARAALVSAELAPLRQERFQREHDFVASLELARSYNAAFELLSGVDLAGLVGDCRQFLADTDDMWRDVFEDAVRTRLRIAPDEATRADALALLRAPEFDRFFPSASMESAVRRQVTEMGVDPGAGGRVIYDTGEREGKRSRAFCAPVRVPDEVYLVLRPHGGQTDYRTLLHELGHALHFGYTRSDLAFEYRWLGDNSVTEAYAMLFDHLLHDAGWLARYTELGSAQVGAFLRAAGLEELQFLRRYCAKLIYEVALHSGEMPWDALPELYVETLSTATRFRYDPADAFVDVDPRFYAARYLRAWQLQSLLTDTLQSRFDEDWWRNPRAGPWIVEQLFGAGQRELADELAARTTGGQLSFSPLIRATVEMLG